MSLEATLIMLDNSSASINGDYYPTRWNSEVQTCSLLIEAKLQSNPQSSVGVGLMGGNQVRILCTMTSDSEKATSYLVGIKSHGLLHFTQSLQIGALSLKHRPNQTQRQRMVCFIGSTIEEDIETLKILGRKLKKSNIAVDLVCFGDCSEEQKKKVEGFIGAIINEDNSHSIFIDSGISLSDTLIGSPIFGGAPGGGNAGFGNLDEEDPELAAAIRMSLQENAHQNAAVQPAVVAVPQIPQPSRPEQLEVNNEHEPTQEQLELLAIQMSLQDISEVKPEEPKEEEQGKKKEESKKKEEEHQKKQ